MGIGSVRRALGVSAAASRLVSAAAEEAHEAEEVSEVVPIAVVVDFVDVEAALEERDHEDKGSDEALPEAEPEPGDGVFGAGGAGLVVRAGRTGGENQEHQESEKEGGELHGGDLLRVIRLSCAKRLMRDLWCEYRGSGGGQSASGSRRNHFGTGAGATELH